jgi:hypothetical protein
MEGPSGGQSPIISMSYQVPTHSVGSDCVQYYAYSTSMKDIYSAVHRVLLPKQRCFIQCIRALSGVRQIHMHGIYLLIPDNYVVDSLWRSFTL